VSRQHTTQSSYATFLRVTAHENADDACLDQERDLSRGAAWVGGRRRHFPNTITHTFPPMRDSADSTRSREVHSKARIEQRKHWSESQDTAATRHCLFPVREPTSTPSESPRIPEQPFRPGRRPHGPRLEPEYRLCGPSFVRSGAATHRDYPEATPRQRPGAQTHRPSEGPLPHGDPPKAINPLRTDVLRREGIPLHRTHVGVFDMLAG